MRGHTEEQSDRFRNEETLVEKSWKYKLCFFLEIYNEEIKDLLQNDSFPQARDKDELMPRARESTCPISGKKKFTEDQIETIIKKARKNRAWAKTLSNERSSRSHSVFMLRI